MCYFSWHCDCSCKVISSFLELSDSKVQKLAEKELQPSIDNGILKNAGPENKQPNSFRLCYMEKETISQKKRIGAQHQ